MADEPKIKRIKLEDLEPDPGNVRLHPDRNRRAIHGSFKRFGAARSIVIDGDGVVRAGSGALEGAREAGVEEVLVIEADGKQLIAVHRPDLRGEDAEAYAIADNRTAELAEWDFPALAAAAERLAGMEEFGWTGQELGDLAVYLDVPDFGPVNSEEQPKLDEKKKVRCPSCGHEFPPS